MPVVSIVTLHIADEFKTPSYSPVNSGYISQAIPTKKGRLLALFLETVLLWIIRLVVLWVHLHISGPGEESLKLRIRAS